MKKQEKEQAKSKDTAKERLHLVLMQDRANVSADFLDLMKQEIIEVIKKYIDVDENEIDVRLTNKDNGDGTNGAPALYANIPIVSIKEDVKSGMARQQEKTKKEETINKEITKIENELEPKDQSPKEKNNNIATVEKWNEEVEKRNQEMLKEETSFENKENAETQTNTESNFQNNENAETQTNTESNFQNNENV